MLSQLDQILRNLQPGMQAGRPQRETPLSKMLDELSELMRKQQGLMDDTQRMQPGEGDLFEPEGDSGSQGNRFSPDALAEQQLQMRELLDMLMRRLGEQGLDTPQSLGEAGKNMEGAEGSLRGADRDGALDQQGEAMAKLREGARGMAEELMQQGQGQQGSYGRHGEARGEDHDPLGRPMRSYGEDAGPKENIVPTELMIRRAREISTCCAPAPMRAKRRRSSATTSTAFCAGCIDLQRLDLRETLSPFCHSRIYSGDPSQFEG